MKRIFWLALLTFVVVSFSAFATLTPPSFSNQQFHGMVRYDAGPQAPLNVIAKANGKDFVSALKYNDCLTGHTCTATYGKDVSNILRVQASAGAKIDFYVDNIFVQSVTYEADTVRELNLTLPSSNAGVGGQNNAQNATPQNTTNQNTTNQNTTGSGLNQSAQNGTSANLSSGNMSRNTTNRTCQEQWNCPELWGACTNGFEVKTCTDLAACNASMLKRNVTRACTVSNTSASTVIPCAEEWECGDYGSCISGIERRSCARADDCAARLSAGENIQITPTPKPSETRTCQAPAASPPVQVQQPAAESCVDGLKNQNEEEVDCGGLCPECSGGKWWFYALPAVVVVLLGGAVFFLVEKAPSLSPEQMQQLSNYFRVSIQRGYTQEQVTDNLIKNGWNKRVIKKFIKKNQL
ncbi:MAG TPA: hypothetical protein VJI15_06260 [Candidatus Nanoarchaeia archaeon]|nr:hypothetical protein [Candidatus Nanoarchaeia archaeon]